LHIGANVGEVIVAARFGPHLGEYMMHCHNGVHEDDEMMRAFMASRRGSFLMCWMYIIANSRIRKGTANGCRVGLHQIGVSGAAVIRPHPLQPLYCIVLIQVSDSIGGKTFASTPTFNVTLLKNTPNSKEAGVQWGDWRDTTYVTADAPMFNSTHVLVRREHGSMHHEHNRVHACA
jgi:Multicopper oxidase